MKFKHTLNVFIDNFSVTYKHLLYRLIVTALCYLLGALIIVPFIKSMLGSDGFSELLEGITSFFHNLLEGNPDSWAESVNQIKNSYTMLIEFLSENAGSIAWDIVGLFAIYLVRHFLTGLGNYATASIINDRMALRADTRFTVALVSNIKSACLYNLMYVPLSALYDIIVFVGLFFLSFKGFKFIHFIPLQLFIYIALIVFLIAVKMTFTSDWLPALIRGRMKHTEAFRFTFNRRKKKTLNVLSNFVVIILIIFAVNVCATVFTFGVAALITIPSSYVILIAFELVNFYDRENLKYFIDRNTIIKPDKEREPTRQEFFEGK